MSEQCRNHNTFQAKGNLHYFYCWLLHSLSLSQTSLSHHVQPHTHESANAVSRFPNYQEDLILHVSSSLPQVHFPFRSDAPYSTKTLTGYLYCSVTQTRVDPTDVILKQSRSHLFSLCLRHRVCNQANSTELLTQLC